MFDPTRTGRALRLRLLIVTLAALAVALGPFGATAAPSSGVPMTDPTSAGPPVAAVRPHAVTHHGVTIEDPYHWLKDPGYPKVDDADVLAHLRAENAWFDAHMAPHAATVETLFQELKGRIKEDDASVPARDGGFEYWYRYETGSQYRLHVRRPVGGGDEQLVLSEPALATGREYFRMGGLAVSPDGRLAAYAVDDDGSERFKLRVRDIATGDDIVEIAANSLGQPVWSVDSATLFWTEVGESWRPFRVRRHRLGAPPGDDPVVYEEADASFFVGAASSQDGRQLIVTAADHVTSEVRLLPLDRPDAGPVLVRARETGREYDLDVSGDTVFVRTNDTHVNYRVCTAPLARPGDWSELIAGSDAVYIRGLTAFASYLAVTERVDGLDQIRLRTPGGAERRVPFPEASYTASLGANLEPDAPVLRLGYTSMVTPGTVYDFDTATDTLTVRKVQEVPSGYDASLYETVRLLAPARDGAMVPVSVVYRKGFPRDGSGRLWLNGYGAYGLAQTPGFSTARISLLDRGFAYAIAHIRGGDDLGYRWYLDGKLTARENTFNDFVDVAKHLIDQGFARAGSLVASGGSAGGTLMGAVVNSDPGLWRAVVADVPFVDVLNTMLDDTLPLTPIEWPEWGNPIADPAAFALLRSYSPYDNVRAQAYPAMLVTAGLNDPRVTYWEPAKWVAKLRATKTDTNPLLLKTNMVAGHGGKSGRFDSLRELAEEYAFVLGVFGD